MLPGDRVGGRFVLRERLVREVWLAHDEDLRRDVVLKRVTARAESQAMARLNHRNVIAVYEHYRVGGQGADAGEWVVMEYAPGGSLADKRMPPGLAAQVGAQIAAALAYLHGKGLVHCDVKPGNIVLAENGEAKLTDFGSAYQVDTRQAGVSRTPGYAAPELEAGDPVPASDVYALAVTVHALVAGAPDREAGGALGPLGDVLPAMLNGSPDDRPTAAEALRQFQAVAAGAGALAGRTTAEAAIRPATATSTLADLPFAVPAQLPPDVFGFAGRESELDRLDALLALAEHGRPATVVISAISGTAGVGKTTLAVHWARRVKDRFPDGQLHVNLRGFDPSGQVRDPGDAVYGFLQAMGVPAERIPLALDARVGMYRSLLDGKRVLVVLDNARDTEQVRDLLPSSPGCLAVVTSRNHLLDLIREQGTRALDLDVLSDDGATQLLEQRLGRDRTAAEPDVVKAMIRACANLPLALAVVAASAATRPHFPLATLANELRDARLDALVGEGADTNVRAVFSWSYDQLTAAAARLFRLLGLHPGPDISAAAAASLAGLSPAGVRPLLGELTRSHLVSENAPGRYTFHDLLRVYAAELAHTIDPADERAAAAGRMRDHYLHSCHVAAKLFRQRKLTLTAPPPADGVTIEELADNEASLAWFTAEHQVLLAVAEQAATGGTEARYLRQLGRMLDDYLNRQGHWHDLLAIWQHTLAGAQRQSDKKEQAKAQREIGRAYLRLSRFDEARTHGLLALDLYAELGDRTGQAYVHRNLGAACTLQGNHAEALEHDKRMLELLDADDLESQATVRNNIGYDYALLGDYERALTWCQSSFDLNRQIGDRTGEASASDSLGYAHHKLGQYDLAVSRYQHALDLFRDLGDRYNEADTLTRLGDTQRATGTPAARDSWQQALAILDDLAHPDADIVRTKLEALDRAAPDRP